MGDGGKGMGMGMDGGKGMGLGDGGKGMGMIMDGGQGMGMDGGQGMGMGMGDGGKGMGSDMSMGGMGDGGKGMGMGMGDGGQMSAASPMKPAALPPKPLDMNEEVKKFCEKYELTEENEKEIIECMKNYGDRWPQDLNELDHSLSRARNPSSLLGNRLRELEALRELEKKAKQGHLPGCMCKDCRGNSFARATGVEKGTEESVSLNAAALAAYQGAQAMSNEGAPAEDPNFGMPRKGKGKGKAPLVMPTGDLVTEVRGFCHRFNLAQALSAKVMDTLQKRTDAEWRQDLAEINRDLSRARNPPALLVVMLGDIQKKLNPNQLCFNYRAGTCTWGDKCRWSHNVATGAERMNSSAIISSSSPSAGFGKPPEPGAVGGFGEGGSSSKVDKLLRRKALRDRSSSSDRGAGKRRKWD